jgi:hypothetical protein
VVCANALDGKARDFCYMSIYWHHNNDCHAVAVVRVFCCLICTLQSVALVDLRPPECDSDSKATEMTLLVCGPNKLHFFQLKAFSVREKGQKPSRGLSNVTCLSWPRG